MHFRSVKSHPELKGRLPFPMNHDQILNIRTWTYSMSDSGRLVSEEGGFDPADAPGQKLDDISASRNVQGGISLEYVVT